MREILTDEMVFRAMAAHVNAIREDHGLPTLAPECCNWDKQHFAQMRVAIQATGLEAEVERLRGLLTEAAHYLDSCGCDEEDCPGRQKAAQLHAVLTGPAEVDSDE